MYTVGHKKKSDKGYYYGKIDWKAECAALTSKPQGSVPPWKIFSQHALHTPEGLGVAGLPLLALSPLSLRAIRIEINTDMH